MPSGGRGLVDAPVGWDVEVRLVDAAADWLLSSAAAAAADGGEEAVEFESAAGFSSLPGASSSSDTAFLAFSLSSASLRKQKNVSLIERLGILET